MSEPIEFRDQLLRVIEGMGGVVSASVIDVRDQVTGSETAKAVIGVELDSGDLLFVEIQPA